MRLLKTKKPHMQGSAVKRCQELCDMYGFDTGPNDGIYGPATEAAVKGFQAIANLKVDGLCGPKTWLALTRNAETLRETGQVLVDIRGDHPKPKLYSYQRTWESIIGVMFHQTGCDMPNNPDHWKNLNAHIGITEHGKCVIVNDPIDMIWHGHGLSKFLIAIEIEGNYFGLDGVEHTLWKPGGGPHHLNEKMHTALTTAFVWIHNQFVENRQEWDHIYAHRQSHKIKAADPGQEIWSQVVLPWARNLNLKKADGGNGYCLSKGRPIPKGWDPARTTKY